MTTRYRDVSTRYRDLQGPTLLRPMVDTSGVDAAQSLSRSFKEFESTALDIGGALREQTGEQAGIAAGAAGTPKPRTGLAALTRFGHAYNNAAEVTYTNKVQTDFIEQMDRIEVESEADPVGYEAKVQGLLEGTLKEAPPEWHAQIQQRLLPQARAGAMRVARQADTLHKQEAVASYLAAAPAAIDNLLKTIHNLSPEEGDAAMAQLVADNAEQLRALAANHAIDPTDAVKLGASFVEQLDKGIAASHITGAVSDIMQTARVNVSDAVDMLDELDQRTDLSDAEKYEIRSNARQEMELLQYERSRKYIEQSSELSRRVAAGETAGIVGQAKALYDKAAISPNEYEGFKSAVERNRQANIEKEANKKAVDDVISLNAGGLDPANNDHVKAVEARFQDVVKANGMTAGDDRWRATALMAVADLNILPKSAESWARVALLSSDPVQANQAAAFMEQVKNAKPNAFAWNNEPKLEALAQTLRDNAAAGVDPVAAYEMARATTWDMKPAEREVRDTEYKRLLKKDPNSVALGEKLNDDRSFWQADLPVPLAAQAEYESLVHQYYLVNGSLPQARELAGQKLKGLWGESKVNGKPEIVKYPPEASGLPVDVIRTDIAESVKPLGIDASKVRLVPGPSTDRTRGQTWLLGMTDELGGTDIVLGPDNRPLEYALPLGESFKKSKAIAKAKNVEQARADRAQEKFNEEQEKALRQYQRRVPL